MQEEEFIEKDWKLFRNIIVDWQEAYMDRLNKEYIEFLGISALTCSYRFSGFCGLITSNNEVLGSNIAIKTTHSTHLEAALRGGAAHHQRAQAPPWG